ncbi:CAAX protease self-immunity-domain-containing protein, partial [Chiua virens]
MISTLTAHLLAAFFATCYVGSIYIFKCASLCFDATRVHFDFGYTRPKLHKERWRDDPYVIRERLIAVSIATVICCAAVFILIRSELGSTSCTTVIHLGLTTTTILPHLIVPLLFLGPLYALFTRESLPGQCNWSFQQDFLSSFFTISGLRNYFIGPITEEIVFRACLLCVYHLAQASRMWMIFLCPLLFGAAHLHHAWETYNRYGCSQEALKRAVHGTVIQFIYTSLFGLYCSYLFLRTGSIFPPISAHIFCNIMGVPRSGYDVSERPDRKLAITAAYVVGIVGFMAVLGRWTATEGTLYWKLE